ncbi:MAG: TIM barrel protein [Planctomycetes bacterium]|nr:TIM barrel protein [Planctomycetota bacterium]MBL7040872.1 TIM barrel protein [Pirellulaceae bacterium]
MKSKRIKAALPTSCLLAVFTFVAFGTGVRPSLADEAGDATSVFAKDNLVAWCIVPFDASKRGPKERAEMLQRLGIKKVAYDWRQEHVPTFEEEILEYKKRGLEYFAFWSWHPDMSPLVKKHGIKPQIWITNRSPNAETQEAKVEAAAKQLMPLVDQARKLGCRLGLYNHGGWGGEPRNMVAVCWWLQKNAEADHVGIVYNFHHGHGHIADFADSLEAMKPYLLCLNLNGMNDGANPKILPIGQGQHEKSMIQAVLDSGYQGPIGILDHRGAIDAEKSLSENLEGLQKLLAELGEAEALKTYAR